MTGDGQDPGSRTVLLAGASGFLGSALAAHLGERGTSVRRLVRRAPSGDAEFIWDPAQAEADEAAFDGVDTVVSLGGAGVFDRPWTAARKDVLLSSRLEPTSALAEILVRRARTTGQRPAWVQGSAIGWYGVPVCAPLGEGAHTEDDPAGSDFLADLCRQWEAAAQPAIDAGFRVAYARTAIVIDGSGGAFKLLRVPFTLGMGAVLGSGQQHFPLLSLRDWLAAITWMVETPDAEGPYNLTIPSPVNNADFSRALAERLHRPLLIKAPERVLRQVLGPMADQLVGDQHVVPQRLLESGFAFTDATATAVIDAAVS